MSHKDSRIVSVWIPPDMLERWQKSAKLSCLSLSEWMRKKCEGQKIYQPVRWRLQK